MKKEEFFACLEKAGEAFEQQPPLSAGLTPVESEEEDDFELRMQEEELARLVAAQMGIDVKEEP